LPLLLLGLAAGVVGCAAIGGLLVAGFLLSRDRDAPSPPAGSPTALLAKSKAPSESAQPQLLPEDVHPEPAPPKRPSPFEEDVPATAPPEPAPPRKPDPPAGNHPRPRPQATAPPAKTEPAPAAEPVRPAPPRSAPKEEEEERPAPKAPPKKEEPPPKEAETARDDMPAPTFHPGARGERVYQYLLKSTALLLHPVGKGPNGSVQLSMGSGSLIDKTNRLILTNYHVVGDADEVFVFFPVYKDGKMIVEREHFFKQVDDKSALTGKVVFRDKTVDLALLRLERLPGGLQALPFSSNRPAPGAPVYSVGHPGSSGGLWVYTEGKIRQAMHKRWKAKGHGDREGFECDADILLTDSPTNPGDSGGPLVNGRGELVAVVHGADPESRLMSLFIDLKEVRAAVERYAREAHVTLALETNSTLAAEADVGGLPEMLRALGHRDGGVRAEAARSLGEMGPAAKVAVPALLKALHDDNDLVRRLALEALNKIGAPDPADVPVLADALKDKDPAVRRCAAAALGRAGAAARPALPALLAALHGTDSELRQAAARALGNLGADAKERAQPALLQALEDEDADVRAAAAEGLAALPLDTGDVPVLLKLLRQPDTAVRAGAARALGKIGPEARTALRALTDLLQDRSEVVRRAALEGLGGIGPDASPVVDDVVRLLKDPRPDVRRAAVDALGGMGTGAKSAARSVAEALSDPELRKNALAALGKIGPSGAHEALPVLAGLLKDGDKEARLEALAALAALKPSGADAREPLRRVVALFGESDEELRDRAVETLAKLGKAALPALGTALNDRASPAVRLGAARALGEIGPPARDLQQQLVAHAAADQDPDVRQACAKALGKLGR
jgi:HEAT repeat protein/S1-C subfamily serine protease